MAQLLQDAHVVLSLSIITCTAVACREERDQRRADIEHLASSLVSKVNECVAAIDEGKGGTVQQCGKVQHGAARSSLTCAYTTAP